MAVQIDTGFILEMVLKWFLIDDNRKNSIHVHCSLYMMLSHYTREDLAQLMFIYILILKYMCVQLGKVYVLQQKL